MSDQVGFSFQADVVNTASMGHVLTGRLLKALSDGGVDTYSLWSAVQLGKLIPVQKPLQNTLYAEIASKKTYHSVLSKALSIGWGHSAPVADLARTVAGSNAIILIGALATGCQPFAAAECLSELMSIYGLEADMLPSVDVLKGLINYLAPFVHDLGFSKVVHHITNVCERTIRSKFRIGDGDESTRADRLLCKITRLGSPGALARAIKQLILTSQKRQSDYMVLEMRGSWLPAFASHVLGMSVELRHGDHMVWASGGARGSVHFQLDKDSAGSFGHSLSLTGQTIVITEPGEEELGQSETSADYLITEALEAQFLKRPEIDDTMARFIKAAITNMSFDIFDVVNAWPCRPVSDTPKMYPLNSGFDMKSSLEEILTRMGIDVSTPVEIFEKPWTILPGLDKLDQKAGKYLTSRCHSHRSESRNLRPEMYKYVKGNSCLCTFVGQVICGFATVAHALMVCRFDTTRLRVQEDVLMGYHLTPWAQLIQPGGGVF
ncbi:hypothetical protein CTA2_7266 [Colletotrichum tanaceti]|uniref:Uncharacterized protein n=1 Tax=Colletotrichum tanaceti TaxID=1306861 RepID=A0A4U6XA69_9PEZI|nr:hypothetical protein CTA2_7266 [Colletotrichum tanaceti]TKW52560.1 hypothetical protein CTA1_13413 [Colletotrichum tanaceti]